MPALIEPMRYWSWGNLQVIVLELLLPHLHELAPAGTWTAVELHGLCDVAGAESNPLPDLRQHLRVLRQVVARQDRVQVGALKRQAGLGYR